MNEKIFLFLCIIYSVYNVIVIFTYGYDKYQAKKDRWRIPERRLMGMAFFFGGPGAFLGMQIFRHKTKHLQFEILVPIFMLLQTIGWVIAARIVL
ncbi:MAG: DUF1294 domain-containing protein [Wujia sp.]